MKLTKKDYYEYVSDLMTETEFEDKILKYRDQFSGLISEDVLAHLIVDEFGRNVTSYKKISELKPGCRASLFATVGNPEPKIFHKQKGTPKGAEVFIFDNTGRGRIVLWDPNHVSLVENGEITLNTKLKLLNAKIIRSPYGLDLTLDNFEGLSINPKDFPNEDETSVSNEIMDISLITEDGPITIIGTISWKSQLRSFLRKDKSKGFVLNLDIYDGTGTIRVTLWDEHAKWADKFGIGDQIKVMNGYSKVHNSVREVHTNYYTKVIKIED